MKFIINKDNKVKINGYNFYKNPFPIISKRLDSLMPFYLWLIYFFILLLEIVFYNSFDLNNLKFDIFLNSSIAGLSLIPVLFGATIGIFKKEDLIKLIIWKNKKTSDEEYGEAFDGIIAPFVLTSIIFLTVGASSLLFSAISLNISINLGIKNIIKLIYLDVLLLGIFILFGTVMCIFQMYYNRVLLDTEIYLNKDIKNKKK